MCKLSGHKTLQTLYFVGAVQVRTQSNGGNEVVVGQSLD